MKDVSLIYSIIASGCLVYLFRKILSSRFRYPVFSATILPFTLHFFVSAIIGWEPWTHFSSPGTYLFWYLIFIIVICCILYRGSLTSKIYISVTFYAFYLLTILYMEHMGNSLFQLAINMDFPSAVNQFPELFFYDCSYFELVPYPPDPEHAVVYNFIYFFILGNTCNLLCFFSVMLVNILKKRTQNFKWKELAYLLLPVCIGISFYIFMTFVSGFLIQITAVNLVKRYGPAFYLLIPVLTLMILFAILHSCDSYEQLVSLDEEKEKAEMLKNQVEQNEKYIQDVQEFYAQIGSIKHDMRNYLFDIKSLLTAKGISVEEDKDGLGEYFTGIGKAMSGLDYCYHTGNPVTDVVINGKYQEARQMGVNFECTFQFPAQYNISAFDISIILNNALNNALEACEKLKKANPEANAEIQMEAYLKNNMFLIEIENTFDGILDYNEKECHLTTRKENKLQHGFGLKNIRNCAEKYLGVVEYQYRQDRFYLTVMLQGSAFEGYG